MSQPEASTSKKGVKRPLSITSGLDETVLDIASAYTCPVCFEIISEAHVTPCGHTFCLKCLKSAIEINKRCPKCTYGITSDSNIFPNHIVNMQIVKYKNSLEIKKRSDKKANFNAMTSIKNFFAREVINLDSKDLGEMINMLRLRKLDIDSQSDHSKLELIKFFLFRLSDQKQTEIANIEKDKKIVDKDLEFINGELKKLIKDSDFFANPEEPVTSEYDIGPKVTKKHKGIMFKDGFNVPHINVSQSTLTAQKALINKHFKDLTDYYLGLRNNFRKQQTDLSSESFDRLGNCMTKFTRFKNFRQLATIDAADRTNTSSNIASSIEFDKDSEFFAVAGLTKKIKIFEYCNIVNDMVSVYYPCGEMICDAKISCISWSAYQKTLLVSSDYDGNVTVWDAFNATKIRVFNEHQKRCWSVDFNKIDHKYIASGSDDGKVKLWGIDRDKAIFTLDAKANVCCVQFNPYSTCHLAFGSADHCVHYYDLRMTKEPYKKFEGHKKAVSYVKFISANEIISASTDSQLKVWDVNKNVCVQSLGGHQNDKNFVGLATDGDYVACGSENNSVYVYYREMPHHIFDYRFEPRKMLLEPQDDSSEFVSAVCWRKGSDVLAAGNSQGLIKLMQLV